MSMALSAGSHRVWCDATSSTETAQINDTVTTFYLMSDCPYTKGCTQEFSHATAKKMFWFHVRKKK
jgi:hypothetical protein